jgi:branched-chain amino acid aminotransferase
MEVLSAIPVKRVQRSALLDADFSNLDFGRYVSDHMLVCDYNHGEWQSPVIVPYTNLSLSPSTLALHYGQTVFEGMKAFAMENGQVNIFRMERHYERFCRSLDRMCMAIPPKEIFVEGLAQLVDTDRAWVPKQKGAALYLRPFVFASEARFGVKISEQYRFIIFTGPVPELYSNPIKVKVETYYVRASKGGTGFAKCGGNYGASYYPTKLAREEGYDQVLWTDSRENKFIEESGMMNVMFVINNKIVTPPLSDSILDGVTRDSLLQLAGRMGYETEERRISIDELKQSFLDHSLTEAFGAGTAAVVAPIKTINIEGEEYHLPAYTDNTIHVNIKNKLNAIRNGSEEDTDNWNYVV